MLAFEVSVNGKRHCLLGTDMEVSSVIVSWTRRHPEKVNFHVGGLIQEGEHAGWKTPQLTVNDEVTIRLVEVDSADTPEEVYSPAVDRGP